MIVVNPSTRQFNIPGADLVFGVEHDNGSEHKYFQCPRYVGNNLDLAASFIRMNYRNANGEVDSYLVKDVEVDGDNIVFSWELSPKTTMYKGQISFVMCAVGPDTKITWHTTLGRGQVLEGLEPDSHMIEEDTFDVVAQLIAMVEAQVSTVEKVGTDQVAVVKAATKAAQDSAVAEIEAKRANSLASIPDDYTSLSNAVDGLVRDRAGAIICETEGTAVAVSDAFGTAFLDMRIVGKSTQNGAPTLDVPLEIKSVEKPVITIAGKNLFDGVIGNYAVSSGSISRSASYTGFACPVVGGYKYTVSRSEISSDRFRFAFTETTPLNGTPFIGEPIFADSAKSFTVLAPVTAKYLVCYLSVTAEDVSDTFFQVEVGEKATEYEPYKSIKTIETANPLRGVPVASGGNYTDSNGQRWICDEVDFERGVYVQRIGKFVADPTLQFALSGFKTNDFNAFYHNVNVMPSGLNQPAVSSHLPIIAGSAYANLLHFTAGLDNQEFYYFVPKVKFPDVESWQSFVASQYNNGTPITTLFILANSIETPLSEAELAAYRTLCSNYPNTTILNDGGAHMKVKYAADTKLYIDNKLAALTGN